MKKQLLKVQEHKKHHKGDHIFVLYWTQTLKKATAMFNAGSIEQITKNNGSHAKIDEMIQKLGVIGIAHFPNVIMYDFINEATSEKICELNNDLGSFKDLEDED
jgi:hypothetical protein